MKLAAILVSSFLSLHSASATCEDVTTQPGFDLESYVSAPWYSHQQAEVFYLPVSQNYCVRAEYSIKDRSSFWGYTVSVNNLSQDQQGNSNGGELCAFVDERVNPRDPSKLKVAPCFLPKLFSGPYWIVAYDESKGYALVSGGEPTIETENGCKTGDGINNSGLWIFLRTRERNEELIEEVRDIASGKGFDLSVLNDVDQSNCK